MKNRQFISHEIIAITGLPVEKLSYRDINDVLNDFASERPNMIKDVLTFLKESLKDEDPLLTRYIESEAGWILKDYEAEAKARSWDNSNNTKNTNKKSHLYDGYDY